MLSVCKLRCGISLLSKCCRPFCWYVCSMLSICLLTSVFVRSYNVEVDSVSLCECAAFHATRLLTESVSSQRSSIQHSDDHCPADSARRRGWNGVLCGWPRTGWCQQVCDGHSQFSAFNGCETWWQPRFLLTWQTQFRHTRISELSRMQNRNIIGTRCEEWTFVTPRLSITCWTTSQRKCKI